MSAGNPFNRSSHLLLFIYAGAVGILAGLMLTVFLMLVETGIHFLWETLPEMISPDEHLFWYPVLVCTVGGLLVGLVLRFIDTHQSDKTVLEAFKETGEIAYGPAPAVMMRSLVSLWAGASLGPEAALIDGTGAMGTWVGKKLKRSAEEIRVLTYGGISGMLGGMFGSPFFGATLALEMPHQQNMFYYRFLLPGIFAATTGFVTFLASLVWSFPTFTSSHRMEASI